MTDAIATFEAKIVPELAQWVRPIVDAARHPDNIRKHRIDKIAQSLRVHGQRAAIVVQSSTGLIVKGNGTHEAAELLGWTELAQVWQEMSDEEAIAYLYADNRASDFSTYDRAKTVAGLQKMLSGPGLFDTLWEVEELEDLVEEEAGQTTLEATGTDATIVSGEAKPGVGLPAGKAPAERMKEIPLIFTLKDHAEFVEQLKGLAKLYGTSATIATIIEAVRRQSAAEAGTPITGSKDVVQIGHAAKRSLVKEFTDYIATFGMDRSFTGTWIMAQFDRMVPAKIAKEEPVEVAPGQVEAFTTDDDGSATQVSPLRAPEPDSPLPEMAAPAPVAPDEEVDDVAALENLARFRAQAAKPVSPLVPVPDPSAEL